MLLLILQAEEKWGQTKKRDSYRLREFCVIAVYRQPIWKFHVLQRKLLRMKRFVSFCMFTCVLILAVVQSSSSNSGTPGRIRTRNTIQKLYGSAISEVYRTPQHLTVTASFASGGNLCRAHIQSNVDTGITDAELDAVLNELAPDDVRGKHNMSTFLNVTCLKLRKPENSNSSAKPELAVDPCAQCSGVSDDYERANITRYGNTNEYSSVQISFNQPECKGLD